MSAGVSAFPTFQFFINGSKVDELRGASPQQLESKVNQHKGQAKGVFDGTGATLGGGAPAWNGVGMPPGSNDRAARLAKFGHIDAKPTSVGAPSDTKASTKNIQSEEDEEAEIAKAIALSMQSLDTAAPAQSKDTKTDDDDNAKGGDDEEDMVPVPVNEEHLKMVIHMCSCRVCCCGGYLCGRSVSSTD